MAQQEGIGAAQGPGFQQEAQQEARGITIGGQQSPPELQGILVQLGRVADQLQEIAKELKSGSQQKPQPFSG